MPTGYYRAVMAGNRRVIYHTGMEGVEDRFAVVGGYRVHYRVAGEGAPIVLVHGVGSSAVTYQGNLPALAQAGRVYAIDLPGHGLSDLPPIEYRVEEGAAFVRAFVEEVCGQPAVLIGLSAGGLMCT